MNMRISDDNGNNWYKFPKENYQQTFSSAITKNPDELLIVEIANIVYDSVIHKSIYDFFLFSIDIEEQTTDYIAQIPTFGGIYSLWAFNYDFVSSKTGIISIKDTDDIYSIYLTDDSLQTWNKIYSSKYDIYSVVMTSANNIGFIGIDSNANFFYSYSEDSGLNWQNIYLPEADTTQMNESYCVSNIHLYFYDENLGFVINYIPSDTSLNKYDILLKTTDGGKHWNMINTQSEKYNTNTLKYFQFANSKIMMVFRYPNILYSRDYGETWTLLPKCMKQGNNMTIYNYALCSDGSVLVPAYIDHFGNQIFSRGQFVTTGIDEPIFNTYGTLLYPNPATDNATLTLDLQAPSNIKIVLNDMLGRELQQIYEGLADAGTFTKSFSTQGLARGVYYLKILIGGDIMIEKVVVN
jgi:hypothetical protein